MTPFALLCQRCGFSQREAAEFLGVSFNSVNSWASDRRQCPSGVIDELRALYARINGAADQALTLIEEKTAEIGDDGEIELGYPADDHEAHALGWPCVGAMRAMLGIVVASIDLPVKLVPRGSTSATAAAADAHDRGGGIGPATKKSAGC